MKSSVNRIASSCLAFQLIVMNSIADRGTDPVTEPVIEPTVRLALFIDQTARNLLPAGWREQSGKITDAVLEAAHRYEIAPLLLTAVIKHESRFNPSARGQHGEIGLMQMKPSTALWLIEEGLVQPFGGMPANPSLEDLQTLLKDPKINIMFGAAYLAQLRETFKDRDSLYLAAYNMGSGNLKSRLRDGKRPHIYSDHINSELVKLGQGLRKSHVKRTSALARKLAAADRPQTFVLD